MQIKEHFQNNLALFWDIFRHLKLKIKFLLMSIKISRSVKTLKNKIQNNILWIIYRYVKIFKIHWHNWHIFL